MKMIWQLFGIHISNSLTILLILAAYHNNRSAQEQKDQYKK